MKKGRCGVPFFITLLGVFGLDLRLKVVSRVG